MNDEMKVRLTKYKKKMQDIKRKESEFKKDVAKEKKSPAFNLRGGYL